MSDITFRFSGSPNNSYKFLWQPEESNQLVTDIMRENVEQGHYRPVFSDLDFYINLQKRGGNVKVELSAVRCRHSGFFFGLQARYRITSLDGSTREEWAPSHFFEQGFYSYAGGRNHDRTLELEDGEFIHGINIQQGEIVDRVTFVTNQRSVHFGGSGGSFLNMSPPEPNQRIIAFAGTKHGVMHRIGYFAKSISWEIIGPLVMLRWLSEQNRALQKNPDTSCTQAQLAVRNLLDTSDDIFRRVLCFLKP